MWCWAFLRLVGLLVFLCHTLLNAQVQNLPVLACPWFSFGQPANTPMYIRCPCFCPEYLNSACLRGEKQGNLFSAKKEDGGFGKETGRGTLPYSGCS